MNILLDYDSTLADLSQHRLNWINNHFGTNYQIEGITTWHNVDYLTMEHEEWGWGTSCFLSEDFQREMPPIAGAIEGVQRILDHGHRPMVVSDRPLSLFNVTREWLDQQGLAIVRLLFTQSKHSKSGYRKGAFTKAQAAYLYQLRVVVEDAGHHALGLAERSYIDKVFLLDTPYNQGIAHEKVQRVKGWDEINV